ncbi:MAG: hypothetical protein AAF503_11540 [Pseudomonadota bacterium]
MIDSRTGTAFLVAAATSLAAVDAGAQSGRFKDIQGTWTGSYDIAFSKNHAAQPNQTTRNMIEFTVYRQQGNLFWVEKRWRSAAGGDWTTEYAVGAFDLDDRDDFLIADEGPKGAPLDSIGMAFGEIEDGSLFITYVGLGDAAAYAVELRRQ